MSAKLKVRIQDKQKSHSQRKQSLRHIHLNESCRKPKENRNRRKESVAKKGKIGPSSSATKLATKLTRKESENSVIYVGTTYLKPKMPRRESIIDLTRSDTTIISWANNYSLDSYDISGDNILDELHLKDQVSSAASIFTIFPPQPQNLFSSPSDELCVCRTGLPCNLSSSKKRNLSTSDVTSYSPNNSPKRVAFSKNIFPNEGTIINDSSDCIWKLKKSYPLTTGLREKGEEIVVGDVTETMEIDLARDIDIMDLVDDLEKEWNGREENSSLTGTLNAMQIGSDMSNL